MFPSNTSHLVIYWYEVIGAINPFIQPKRALELKLSNLKFCKLHAFHLPTCLTTTIDLQPKLATGRLASILSQYEVYFHLHKPFLFSWRLLSSSVSRLQDVGCLLVFTYFMVHYPIRDLQRRLGLLKQGVTIFTITYSILQYNTGKNIATCQLLTRSP